MNNGEIRVTVIVDNRAEENLEPEHGLAMWIEVDGKKILFDTGQGLALEKNSRALGVDLAGTEILVLSHGHFDHTGGVDFVLHEAPDVEVYCHSESVRPRYAVRNGEAASIHMPRPSMAALDKRPGGLLHWITGPVMITENAGLTGPVPRLTDYEDVGGPFFLDTEGNRPDLLTDDMSLFFKTDDGVVVCAGCCHSGIVNTLDHVKKISGCEKIRAVIGGFHLVNASHERMEKTKNALKEIAPDFLAPCHCTGDLAVMDLKSVPELEITDVYAGRSFLFKKNQQK